MKIKVGDIFYENHGLARFYQVVKVYESGRVKIRRVEEKELRWISGYEKEVLPDINNFSKEDRLLDSSDNKGVIRLVDYSCSKPCICITYNCYGWLWDGEPVISSYWYIWMR